MMGEQLPAEIMEPLAAFLAQHLGLSFPPKRWRDLLKGLATAAPELGFREPLELAAHLLAAPVSREVLAVLASQLTIGETYFFREKGTFTALATKLLPPLVAARRAGDRRLRLWSAGCASGEEAYSLAILLHQTIPDWAQWQIQVLATDINPRALEKARRGIYTAWSFRGVSPQIMQTYFTPVGNNGWEIKPWLRQLVTFAPLNLAQDPFPSPQTKTTDLDVIFCRNVLMYLTPEVVAGIIEKFAAALQEGGWLIVSPAECSLVQAASLRPCPQDQAIPFQKISRPRPESRPLVQAGPRAALAAASPQAGPAPAWEPRAPSASPRPLGVGPSRPQGQEAAPAAAPLPEPPPAPPRPAAGGSAAGAQSTVEPLAEAPGDAEPLAEAPGDAAAMAALAQHYANLGHWEMACHWGEQARRQDCLNPHHYYLQAAILMEQQRYDEAGRLLRQALYLQHDFILAHFLLGRLSLEQERPQEALRHFNNTLCLLDNYPDEESVPAAAGVTMGALRQVVSAIKNRLCEAGGRENAVGRGQ